MFKEVMMLKIVNKIGCKTFTKHFHNFIKYYIGLYVRSYKSFFIYYFYNMEISDKINNDKLLLSWKVYCYGNYNGNGIFYEINYRQRL